MNARLAFLALAAGMLALTAGATGFATSLPAVRVNDAAILEDAMPRKLSDYRFFANLRGQQPIPRVFPYELNTPLWSDGADKLRFVYLPEGSRLETDGEGLLQFPVGSAIIKTFAFGEGDDRRLIETRVLLHRAEGWVALPYRWNAEQTDASLALAGGRLEVTTETGEAISYRIPNKNQCKTCHSLDDAVVPIGPKARNLDHEWLEMMVGYGLLGALPQGSDTMPDWHDESAPVAARARAYLDVNCAHCHQPSGGASNSGLDLRWEQNDAFAIGVRKPPVAAGRGAGGFLVSIEPGEPDKSILVHRMNSNEPGVAMPELGRSSIDTRAVALMREWIAEMEGNEGE